MNKWQRFRRLPALSQRAFLQALVLLPVTGATLRLMGFQRWKSFLANTVPHENPVQQVTPELLADSAEMARMVNAAAREGLFHARCLEKSLVLWWLLRRKGAPAELRIGVRHAEKGFEAHAWVVVQGNIVDATEFAIHEFVPFNEDFGSLGVEPR